jgi:peptidoglycan/xylan/chitin deacetylase (PgdA/CDA1 family)
MRAVAARVAQLSGLNTLRTFIGSPSRILMYHRVVNPEEVPWPLQAGMYVRPETFELHCEILKQEFNVVPLSELLQQRKVPRRTVGITFDDGWIDNFTLAFPILKRFELPATIFLPTAFIGTGRFFWTDLVAIYLKEREMGLKLESLEAMLFKAESDPLEILLNRLFALPVADRNEIIKKLDFTLHAAKTLSRYSSPFINWEQAREMEDSGLITFGNHSHTHPLLGEISSDDVGRELSTAKALLESNLKAPLAHVLAYPGGSVPKFMPEGFVGVHNRPMSHLGRIGIHEDVASQPADFRFRMIWQR